MDNLYYQPATISQVSYAAIPGLKRELTGPTIEKIIADTARAFEVETDMLSVKCRYPRVKYARWIVWKILYSRGYSLKECGRLLGNHDHTTIMHALDTLERDLGNIQMVQDGFSQVEKYMGNVKKRK